MKKTVFLLIIAWSFIYSHDFVPGILPEDPLTLYNAKIHPVSSDVIENGIIVLNGEKIQYIGSDEEKIPAESKKIDLKGASVYPGLIAANTQLGLVEIGFVRATNDSKETGDVNPNIRSDVAYNPDSEIIPTLRSNGILHAEVVPKGDIITGLSSLMALDGWDIKNTAAKSKVAIHVNFSFSKWGSRYRTQEAKEKRIHEMAEVVRKTLEDTQAYQKMRNNGKSAIASDSRLEAMLPVIEGKLPLFIHANSLFAMRKSLAIFREFEIQGAIVGAKAAADMLDELKEAGFPLILQSPLALPPHEDDDYDILFNLAASVKEAGIPFCLSQDGSWVARNLPYAAARSWGLSESEILKSITLDAAKILGIDDKIGSLDIGKEATLFVSEGNILHIEESNVTLAFIKGRPVNLDDRHKQLYEKYKKKYE